MPCQLNKMKKKKKMPHIQNICVLVCPNVACVCVISI